MATMPHISDLPFSRGARSSSQRGLPANSGEPAGAWQRNRSESFGVNWQESVSPPALSSHGHETRRARKDPNDPSPLGSGHAAGLRANAFAVGGVRAGTATAIPTGLAGVGEAGRSHRTLPRPAGRTDPARVDVSR